MTPRRILCISLSPLNRDARVLRQIKVLREFGHVTTVGYGPPPADSDRHIEVPANLSSLPQTPSGVALLALRRWAKAELSAPAVAFALDALADERFDLVVANDARVLALADRVRHGAPLWADMHEWAPEERTHVLRWRILVAPLMTHLCRAYLPRAAAVSTVCASIANLYSTTFGVSPAVVRNSSERQSLAPSPLRSSRIRLVHSGAAVHGRSLETMIDAMRLLDSTYTLDFYLVPGGDGGAYLRKLQSRAANDHRITFHAPVKPDALPETLNQYDVGVFWIPPTHTNARYTLPNKFFDYVQARLCVAVGPSVEMQRLVMKHRLGVVSEGFSAVQGAASLRALRPEDVEEHKRASDESSAELSFDVDRAVMRSILNRLTA